MSNPFSTMMSAFIPRAPAPKPKAGMARTGKGEADAPAAEPEAPEAAFLLSLDSTESTHDGQPNRRERERKRKGGNKEPEKPRLDVTG